MSERLAVLTSGGDAPGMNAAIRAVVRAGVSQGWEVYGVRDGFAGLMAGDMARLGARDVGGIMQRGGTVLGSARAPEFVEDAAQLRALESLAALGIGRLIAIGGNGTQKGSLALSRRGLAVIGVASTIDNDLPGSDITLGSDTALNVALEALDRIRTTAESQRRIFLVEVMGRHCGYLALMSGIAGGAESIVLPEMDPEPEDLLVELRDALVKKGHAVAVVAEGWREGAAGLAAFLRQHQDRLGQSKIRTTVLGHVQRGGQPSSWDRLLGTRLGAAAVGAMVQGQSGLLIGLKAGRVDGTPLAEVADDRKTLDPELVQLARILSR